MYYIYFLYQDALIAPHPHSRAGPSITRPVLALTDGSQDPEHQLSFIQARHFGSFSIHTLFQQSTKIFTQYLSF